MLRQIVMTAAPIIATGATLITTVSLAHLPKRPVVVPWYKPNVKVSKEIAFGVATMAGIAAVAYYIRRKPQEVELVFMGEMKEESIIVGSNFVDRPIPTCQAMIGFKTGDAVSVVGCGIRTEYGFWTPAHVIGSKYKEAILVKNGQAEPLGPYIKEAIQNQFGLEMVCIQFPDPIYAKMGITKASFTNLSSDKDLVTIVGPDGKSTMGELARTPGNNFGSVVYGGSTTAGFSGAPYMKGNKVVAIHLHGGRQNGGQEIMYLNQMWKLESILESIGGEPTGEKIARKVFAKNKRPEHQIYGDMVVFRDDTGHYHRVGLTSWQKLEEQANTRKFADEPDDWNDEDDDYDRYSDASSASSHGRYKIKPDEWDEYWGKNKRHYEEEAKKVFREVLRKKEPHKGKIPKYLASLMKGEAPPTRRENNPPTEMQQLLTLLKKNLVRKKPYKKHTPWLPRQQNHQQPLTPLSSKLKEESEPGPSTSTQPPTNSKQ